MAIIRLTKLFRFEMAHALWNYNGMCRNIHGHSYKLYVTIIGKPLDQKAHQHDGMVIDFNQLKNIIYSTIINEFDHATVISNQTPINQLKNTEQIFDKLLLVNYQPTCENLLNDFVQRIKKQLPPNVSLYSLKLCETKTSFAEWFAADN